MTDQEYITKLQEALDKAVEKLADAEMRIECLREVVSAARHAVIWCDHEHKGLRKALTAMESVT